MWRFFIEQFHSDEPPGCDLFESGEIPVVELELMNGETCDVYYFEAFRKRIDDIRAIKERLRDGGTRGNRERGSDAGS